VNATSTAPGTQSEILFQLNSTESIILQEIANRDFKIPKVAIWPATGLTFNL
jgi:hypothetical protein